MKRKIVNILFICIFLTVFSWTVKALTGDKQTANLQINAQKYTVPGDLSIIDSVTRVRIGEIGFITIQGQPGIRYTVTSSFNTEEGTRSVSQWRITDENGRATFLWSVSLETIPGTYPVTISGGDRTLKLSHVVLP
jgi:hypothetical protein